MSTTTDRTRSGAAPGSPPAEPVQAFTPANRPPRTPLRRAPRPSSWALKVAMAITGTIWALFVLVHLFGNLKVFTGAEHFNSYAHWLRHAFAPLLPEESLLWALRIALVIALVIHVAGAAMLWSRGRRARGPHRATARARRTGFQGFSARLMPVTGVFVLAFIVVHILDLTTGTRPIASAEFVQHTSEGSAAYGNLVASFARPWMAAIYAIAMVLLALHVAHGSTTVATDLGAMGRRLRAFAAILGGLAAIAILLGNAAIPLAVQLGVLS